MIGNRGAEVLGGELNYKKVLNSVEQKIEDI